MDEDRILNLAVALYHAKGAYALLLGSGVSRSANIPTGWEIVVDLIHQLAALHGEECTPGGEEAWYRQKFGTEPTYDQLLAHMTSSKTDRARILAGYIEPTAQDLAEEKKVPQAGHRAVARLVRNGYIRVIVTTNFDHLLEQAIQSVGVTPRIIATPEAIEQALPLVHERCTIMKVHGDYTSGDLKNTSEELAAYDERLNRLLERVFGDFGLIVCGWSADWDTALRAVLERSASRAYSTFWAVKGKMGESAWRLMETRYGREVIMVEGADAFFETLEDKVEAIRRVKESPTLLPDVARARMERLLEAPYPNRINVRNLVMAELDPVIGWLSEHKYLPEMPPGEVTQQLDELASVLAPTIAMLVTGGRWGEGEQRETWAAALERVIDSSRVDTEPWRWTGYWAYTGYLMLYATALGGIAAGRHEALAGLLEARTRRFIGRPLVPTVWLLGEESFNPLGDQLRRIRPNPREYRPLSEQLFETLQEPLASQTVGQARYEEAFDRLEYLIALAHVDYRLESGESLPWAPTGRFIWRDRNQPEESGTSRVRVEAEALKGEWPPLRVGLFGGDVERFERACQSLDAFIERAASQMY